MSSTSIDEDEPIVPLLRDENYTETCDEEVNDIVPRLERLCISDNEPIHLPSGNLNIPDSSMNTVPSSINIKESSITESNKNVSPVSYGDVSGKISVKEDSKAAVASPISLSGNEEISRVCSSNMQVGMQSQGVIQRTSGDGEIQMHPIHTQEKILNIPKEMKETGAESIFDENPLDLSSKCNLDPNNTSKSNFVVSVNKTELQSLMVVPEKMEHVDPETGEIAQSSSILPDTSTDTGPDTDSNNRAVDEFADKMACGLVSDFDSPKLSYSADISSDDQSNRSSGIMLDSPPETPDVKMNAISVRNKRSRKIGVVNPVSVTDEINRQRQSGIFQPPFRSVDASKKHSSSDEDCKNSRSFGKDSSIGTRRKCKKVAKFSPRQIDPDHLNVKMEEKRPSPCKRKKSLSDNTTETSGKFRKRFTGEHNSDNGEETHLVIRSRSSSLDMKNIEVASVTNPPTKNSNSQTRKRANSDCHIASRVKFRRPTRSSDEDENK